MSKIGFIGLGIVAEPMSRNLLEAGHALVVFDVVTGPVAELVEAGAARGECCRGQCHWACPGEA